MSLVTLNYVFTTGATIIASQHNLNNSVIYNDYNGNITDANIASNAGIEYTKLALSGTIKATDLNPTTVIPVANGGTGATGTVNSANGVVVLNSSAQLPAVSGALLTNLPAGVVSTGYAYGTSSSSSTTINSGLKIAYGESASISGSGGSVQITNLPFTSGYSVTTGTLGVGSSGLTAVIINSNSAFTLYNYNNNTMGIYWIAVGV